MLRLITKVYSHIWVCSSIVMHMDYLIILKTTFPYLTSNNWELGNTFYCYKNLTGHIFRSKILVSKKRRKTIRDRVPVFVQGNRRCITAPLDFSSSVFAALEKCPATPGKKEHYHGNAKQKWYCRHSERGKHGRTDGLNGLVIPV